MYVFRDKTVYILLWNHFHLKRLSRLFHFILPRKMPMNQGLLNEWLLLWIWASWKEREHTINILEDCAVYNFVGV